MRNIVIGDIHGAYRALKQLINTIELSATDRLIFMGDYVDGWSESFEVVDYLISLSRKRKENNSTAPIFLRGNHDQLFVDYLQGADANDMWLFHGGQSTVQSYEGRAAEKVERHLKFLKDELVDFYELENMGFFHAGFQNLKGPHFEHFPEMTYWDRTLWEMARATDPRLKPDDPAFPPRLTLYDRIFIGHTPTTRMGKTKPVTAMNVTNVDTGAAFKGPVSALCIETDELWQSEPAFEFYPDEEGRNKS
jgi:serine/threonine protein phosphatase 1